MRIQERAFLGKTFRPKTHFYFSSNKKLLAVITPWGQESTSPKHVFENLESLYSRLSEDKESTHPFPKLMSLNSMQNDIRTAVLQINQDLFSQVNQEEYAMGFELFFLSIVEHTISFIQIGQPFVLIDRPSSGLRNIGQMMDISLNNFIPHEALPPLPHQLLGIYGDISFSSFCFRFHPKDRLILLSRNAIPPSWFSLKREERTQDNFSQKAVADQPQTPFWLAIVDLT